MKKYIVLFLSSLLTPTVFAASVTLNPKLRAYNTIEANIGAHPDFGIITANGWITNDTLVLDTAGVMKKTSSKGNKIGNFEHAGSINIVGESGKNVAVKLNVDHGTNALFEFTEPKCKWDSEPEADCSTITSKKLLNTNPDTNNVATSVLKVGGKVTFKKDGTELSHNNLLDSIALKFDIVYS